MSKKRITTILFLAVMALNSLSLYGGTPTDALLSSKRPRYDKLSPMLRQTVRSDRKGAVCAFVQTTEGGETALREKGCRLLTSVGDISIAIIPHSRLSELSRDNRVLRIEANRHTRALTDSVAIQLNAVPVYEGQGLPQAFTGRGVVVGVMDIGFDLTHPNFYSRDTTEYRIHRFWDMLSADTVGSTLPVGRDFSGRQELLTLGHARDGLDQTHGTHTTGIAAGSGYDTPYMGLAPESDICLVANAVTEDTIYIAPEDYDKYTFATDALGFKYIFDYAESQGKPCVINFSEGSQQDFWGYDQLYYEMLRRISGPGRIIVSAAGNSGNNYNWFRKAPGVESAGTFFISFSHDGMVTMKGDRDFDIRFVGYEENRRDTIIINTSDIVLQEDSILTTVMKTANDSIVVTFEAYPSCYNANETCYDITLSGKHNLGGGRPYLSLEVMGRTADVEVYRVAGYFLENGNNPALSAGDISHSVLSPASAPCVICVGATAYRTSFINYKGEQRTANNGTDGVRSPISSVGPTFDGRIKPDVMAPGINIISSYSSYYLEHHPYASDINSDVSHFEFNGRTYSWNGNSGTSMSSPVVAGVIALWLQVCPTLTTDDILGIFERTCRHYDPDMEYPNNLYGYGEIDAYAGLLDILGASNISQVSSTHTKAHVAVVGDRELEVTMPTTTTAAVRLSVFSLNGSRVAQKVLEPACSTARLSLPVLRKGDIYIVQIDGDATCNGSTIIRM